MNYDPLRRHGFPAGLMRAQRAVNRGLEALGRRPRTIATSTWALNDPEADVRRHRELEARTALDVAEAGRELIARGLELEAQAETAKRAGVEALRSVFSPQAHMNALPWAELGELLGMSAQGAHKRYRDVEAPEPELTLDDVLADA